MSSFYYYPACMCVSVCGSTWVHLCLYKVIYLFRRCWMMMIVVLEIPIKIWSQKKKRSVNQTRLFSSKHPSELRVALFILFTLTTCGNLKKYLILQKIKKNYNSVPLVYEPPPHNECCWWSWFEITLPVRQLFLEPTVIRTKAAVKYSEVVNTVTR